MRKCPFCAEEIQQEAIKCKHCGEWLPAPDQTNQVGNPRKQPKEEDKPGFTGKEGESRTLPTTGTTKRKDIYVQAKQKSKYGWGWFFWLGLALAGMSNLYLSDTRLYALAGAIPFVSLIPYFALRLRFLSKWSYSWKAGLAAGVCMYILSVGLFSIISVVDGKTLSHNIRSVDEKYKTRLVAFTQNETRYEAKLIRQPKNEKDMKHNVKTIDQILAHGKDKQQLFHDMFDDYKQAVRGKRSTADKKPLEETIDEISSRYDDSHHKWHKSWKLLRTYYVTGQKRYLENYEKVHKEATQSAADVQERMAEAFSVAGKRGAE